MVSITLSVPEEIREIMKKHPEINWSVLVRKMLIEKAKELSLKEEMFKELNREKSFSEWAVNIVRKGRKNEADN